MKYTISDMRNKEVINVKTGAKLGFIDDVEIDSADFSVKSLIVYGRYKFFGLLGREDDLIINCRNVKMIGVDTVLVFYDEALSPNSQPFAADNL